MFVQTDTNKHRHRTYKRMKVACSWSQADETRVELSHPYYATTIETLSYLAAVASLQLDSGKLNVTDVFSGFTIQRIA